MYRCTNKCLLRTCAAELQRYLEYAIQLEYEEKPDYVRCRKLFHDAIVKSGGVDDGRLVFASPAARQVTLIKMNVIMTSKFFQFSMFLPRDILKISLH